MSQTVSTTPSTVEPQADPAGKKYWRSLDELRETPEFRAFVDREFPNFNAGKIPEATRRQFLRVMGASMALAGLTGCRWPREEILPYTERPENSIPGKYRYFATSFDVAGYGRPLVATSYDGRPLKLEGNDLHPESHGATDLISQASVLDLYDPDRSTAPATKGAEGLSDATWAGAQGFFDAIRGGDGSGVAVLAEAASSRTRLQLQVALASRFPKLSWFEYEGVSRDNIREGLRLAFGKAYRPHYDLGKTKVIVDLGADLLMGHPGAVGYARGFADGRREYDLETIKHESDFEPNRLYSIESVFSVTGSNADHRLPLHPGQVSAFTLALAKRLVGHGLSLPGGVTALIDTLDAGVLGAEAQEMVGVISLDLIERVGRMDSLIAAGPGQPPAIHALVAALNEGLGNVGRTVSYTLEPGNRQSHGQAIAQLTAAMKAGEVSSLLILGGNPAYDAPASLGFGAALAGVATSVHLATHRNETSHACSWHLPRSHYLEAWNDTLSYGGVLSVAQPLIAPLYDSKSDLEVLSMLVDDAPLSGHDLVRRSMKVIHGGMGGAPENFERDLRQVMHDGLIRADGTGRSLWTFEGGLRLASSINWSDAAAALRSWQRRGADPASGAVDVVLYPDRKLFDGRFANNGWLQETPDSLSKLTWDNAALMSSHTAAALGVKTEHRLRLNAGGVEVVVPAFIMPGMPDHVIGLALGYGREHGSVCSGVGVDAFAMTSLAAGAAVASSVVPDVKVSRAGGISKLASTQSHNAIDTLHTEDLTGDAGYKHRVHELFREAPVEEYRKDRRFAQAGQFPTDSLWEEPLKGKTPTYKWGMSIDLNGCIGCSACVVACTAENNVPVVGKSEIIMGREMQWLRVDRYFSGEAENPEVGHMPVPCQQCENAPCEQVCPVAATVHSDEGLNDMVYNRCIGTRYCSNNCPYKVRRFNYFNHHVGETDVDKMKHNPNVTVRERGVMEKCTYCVQRIAAVRIPAKNEGRRIQDGEITTACAQACPTGAIVFGDLADPTSRVSKLQNHIRSYNLLNELNVKPRTAYLAKLRNPKKEA